MKKIKAFSLLGSLLLTGMYLESCITKPKSSQSSEDRETVKVSLNVKPSEGLASHGLHLVSHKKGSRSHKKGLHLASVDAVTAYQASIHGCKLPHGAPSTVDKNGSFFLYKKATGCFVVLDSLTVGDFTYERVQGDPVVDNWAGSQVVDMKAGVDTHIAHLKVDKQVTNPVVVGTTVSSVAFSFTITAKGTFSGKFASTKAGVGITVTGKQPLPDFVIDHQENNIEIDTSGGAGQDHYHFSLFLKCAKTDNIQQCNGINLTRNFDYIFTDTNVDSFDKGGCMDAFKSKNVKSFTGNLTEEIVGNDKSYFFETEIYSTKSKKVALILRARDNEDLVDSSFKYFIFELPDSTHL